MIRSRLRGESGLSLVEVMVVTALMALVMTFVLRSVVTYQTAATGGIRRLENLDEGRLLMQVMSKDIRTAAKLDATTSPFVVNTGSPTFTLADNNEVWLYANLNLTTACPKRIRIYVDASSKIIEAIYEPTGGTPPACTSYPATPTRNRIVGRFVANTSSQPIFTYYYRDTNDVLTPFCPSATAPGCSVIGDQTPLSVSNALLVDAVGIQLSIRKDTTLSVDHTTLTNTVRLANVYYYPAPSTSP